MVCVRPALRRLLARTAKHYPLRGARREVVTAGIFQLSPAPDRKGTTDMIRSSCSETVVMTAGAHTSVSLLYSAVDDDDGT